MSRCGFSKKESQQKASEQTLKKLRSDDTFLDSVFAAKSDRTQMEEMPVSVVPAVEPLQEDNVTEAPKEKSREDIIAEAENQAYN